MATRHPSVQHPSSKGFHSSKGSPSTRHPSVQHPSSKGFHSSKGSPIWQERYRPHTLEAFEFAPWLPFEVKNHVLVYGPEGSGKRSRVRALLADTEVPRGETPSKKGVEHRGETLGVERGRVTLVPIKDMNNTPLIVTERLSSIEIDFSQYGNKDRIIVQQYLRPACEERAIGERRIFVLLGADFISPLSQKMLLSVMEKTPDRFILVARSSGKIIEPLRSRTMAIRQRSPTQEELMGILARIAQAEGIKVTKKRLQQFAESRNIARAIHHLQMSYANPGKFKSYKDKDDVYLVKLTKEIEKRSVMGIRRIIYTLISKNTCAVKIFKFLAYYFASKTDRADLIWGGASYYEGRLRLGNKVAYYLDAFIAYSVNVLEGVIWTSTKCWEFPPLPPPTTSSEPIAP